MSLKNTSAPRAGAQQARPTSELSPRRQRLRATLVVLAVAGVLGVAAGIAAYLLQRPTQYEPGEENKDVTSELARGLPPEAPRPRFTDVTREAGLDGYRTFRGDRTSQLPEDNGPGLAWGDFDNDGDDDVFLVSAGGPLKAAASELASSELYENLGQGRFRKVTVFPDLRIWGMAAAWGDYDEDGHLDLAVTGFNTLMLLRNEGGTGRFKPDERFANRRGYWAGASWGDYDNDRHLDLYVCGYVQYVEDDADRERISSQLGTSVPYSLNPASYAAGTNLLFHNHGDGTFAEVAGTLGVANPEGRSLGAVWHDFDDDGWLDLYVANDISDNVFYHNLGGRFEDISHAAYVADYRSAMGLAVGDYNRDGDDDMFVGHWVAQENALYDNLLADLRAAPKTNSPPRPAAATTGGTRTNKRPAVVFLDIADMKGLGQIALPYVSWGAEFCDFDGDGWLDLVVANGNTIEAEGPPPKKLKPQASFLFWNRRGEFFHNLAPLDPMLARPRVSRGLGLADYDSDGDVDILIAHLGEGVQLLRNEMQTGRWLKLRLRSRLKDGSPRGFGDGARVTAWAGGIPLRRAVTGVSYLSQNSRTLHFGLGDATRAERVEVRWLAGGTNAFMNLDGDTTWEIVEGESTPKRVIPQPATNPGAVAAAAARPAPQDEKGRLLEFWNRQRAAMNAMKVEKDIPKATHLFESALELNPVHEDSRYYLAQCLASQERVEEALAQLSELTRINPQSHRGFQQWGTLRAVSAKSPEDLAAAEAKLEKAHSLNPEETGALQVLGELALVRGAQGQAEEKLAQVCRTNPRAAGALFLRGYVAWKCGDPETARKLLRETRQALGSEWQPKGATSEGDVRRKQHAEGTPLARFWEQWDGMDEPATAFARLEKRLASPQPAGR